MPVCEVKLIFSGNPWKVGSYIKINIFRETCRKIRFLKRVIQLSLEYTFKSINVNFKEWAIPGLFFLYCCLFNG